MPLIANTKTQVLLSWMIEAITLHQNHNLTERGIWLALDRTMVRKSLTDWLAVCVILMTSCCGVEWCGVVCH